MNKTVTQGHPDPERMRRGGILLVISFILLIQINGEAGRDCSPNERRFGDTCNPEMIAPIKGKCPDFSHPDECNPSPLSKTLPPYEILIETNEATITCGQDPYNQWGQRKLRIHIPSDKIPTQFRHYSLEAKVDSELECQRERIRIIDAGKLNLKINVQTLEEQRTEYEKACHHSYMGGGERGYRSYCDYYPVQRTYLVEILSSELNGRTFSSKQESRKETEDYPDHGW